ncbi:hypothetical protein [Actinomadura montaniterrae]|nr:hypothetical protein [Actinomadura montaniterrae]
MVPQTKKIWPTIATIAALVYAIKNPVEAGHAINHLMDSAFAFMGAIG